MKKTIALMALLLTLALLLTGCASDYRKGVIDGNVWESKWLGLRFQCSDSMMIFEQNQESAAEAEEYGLYYEMSAVDTVSGGNILIAVAKLGDENMDMESFLELTVAGLEDSGGVTGEAEETMLGGIEFTLVPVEMDIDGVTGYMNLLVCIRDGYAVQITVSAFTQEEVDSVLDGFSAL